MKRFRSRTLPVSASRIQIIDCLVACTTTFTRLPLLVISTGAGAEMRQSLGTAVFAGMIGVTGFGLLFTPVFYVLARKFSSDRRRSSG